MANLTMLEDDWGAKGAQMTGAQVQQIIKDALRQCAQWATEPEDAQMEEAEYMVVNVDGVPKKVSVQMFKEMIVQSDELREMIFQSDELKDMILQSDELKEMISQSDELKEKILQSEELREIIMQYVESEESVGQDFINELFGIQSAEE